MSYHLTNFGIYAAYVRGYADMGGYVPQPGDRKEDFGLGDMTDEEWAEHVAGAVKATNAANAAIDEWRKGSE